MTDEELIARLRSALTFKDLQLCPTAADRIELLATTNEQLVATNEALSISNATLIAERDKALEWLSASQGYIADAVYALDKQEAAEAKLAENEVRLRKAVEALEFLEIAATGSGVPHPKERELLHDCIRKARATLAEIKSHSDEFATQKGENHE